MANSISQKTILLPQIRSIEYFPPVITWINFMCSKGFRFILLAHRIERNSYQYPEQITFIEITGKPYPLNLTGKLSLKIKAAIMLFNILKSETFDLVWVCVWDFKYIRHLLNFTGYKGKLVFQFLELDPKNFPYCKYADHVIVPEENRAWLTYFMAKLPEKPWLLPNIPIVPAFENPLIPAKIKELTDNNKIIVFYSGLIHFYRRCLSELIAAVASLDDRFCLVIMPGRNPDKSLIRQVETEAQKQGAENRIHIIESMPAPSHLAVFRYASVGIGLYRPSSLNQVYAAPNRIYEFTAFGVPVILPEFPKFASLENKYPGAIVTVDPENVPDIAGKLQSFADPEFRHTAQQNARRYFAENGHYELFAGKIAKKLFSDAFPDE